jgi:transcriptional regulator with XRE-family HTH domain
VAYTKPDPPFAKIGARLALTRRALTLTRFQMARVLGTDMPHLGHLRSRHQSHPPEQALKLSAYGIPLDWIYQGRMTDLHPHIRDKIRLLAR